MNTLENSLLSFGKNLAFGIVLNAMAKDSTDKEVESLLGKVRAAESVARQETIQALSLELGISEEEIRSVGRSLCAFVGMPADKPVITQPKNLSPEEGAALISESIISSVESMTE